MNRGGRGGRKEGRKFLELRLGLWMHIRMRVSRVAKFRPLLAFASHCMGKIHD